MCGSVPTRLLTARPDRADIVRWLREDDPGRLEMLWRQADEARRRHVGDEVHLRGLIEISNHCARHCHYCGIRADNPRIERYRMNRGEILDCARQAESFGYGTVVIQAGEDYGLTKEWVADLVREIKRTTDLAVTLSLGERREDELRAWRAAGADRYLLRFETSNEALYRRIHPSLPGRRRNRFDILRLLRGLGYEVGSGVMIGIPGQRYGDLAEDILWFTRLDLDMIGVGPFIAHPETPLGRAGSEGDTGSSRGGKEGVAATSDEAYRDAGGSGAEQVPPTELMTYKVVALARLVCPRANIPSTTALATLNLREGRELGLCRGANVVMPNVTPPAYRSKYEIYPSKACVHETAGACQLCMRARIESLGRRIGRGRGDSPNRLRRVASATVTEVS